VCKLPADLFDLGRFSQPGLFILASLAGGPKHGYALMQDVAEAFGVQLGPGTLYGALSRLERGGLIEPLPAQDRRRPYRLTTAGAQALGRQLVSLRDLALLGLERLAVPS